MLSAILKIGSALSEDEYSSKVTPVIIRLFGNPDRVMRVCLLDNLPLMIPHLAQKAVNDKIFPQMVSCSPYQRALLIVEGYWLHR